jgi:hypothetical protein
MDTDEGTVLDIVQTAQQVRRLHLGTIRLEAIAATITAGELILQDAVLLRSKKLLQTVTIVVEEFLPRRCLAPKRDVSWLHPVIRHGLLREATAVR